MKRRVVKAADLFCGAGGSSTGLALAAQRRKVRLDLVAVNHWKAAIDTHEKNHPDARHFRDPVVGVDPRKACPSGHLDILIAGPECTHHSSARGGKPINDQSRSSAFHILRWLELLKVDRLLIENVPDFESWAPLDTRGRPMKSKKGAIFKQYLKMIEALGYTRIDYKILNAADYGEAQTRRRLFIQAVRGRREIIWPEPTHGRKAGLSLLREVQKWRPAREIIDWSIPTKSIFTRKKALSENTMRRIAEGLKRFGGEAFVLGQQTGSVPRSVNEPIPTLSTDCAVSLTKPFLLPPRHLNDGHVDSVEDPLRTITAVAGHVYGLAQPFLVGYHGERPGEKPRVQSLDAPLATLSTENRFGLAHPFLVPMYGERSGQVPRTHSVDEPVPTIPATGGGKFGLAQPFVVNMRGTDEGHLRSSARSLEDPLTTIAASGGKGAGHHGLVESFMLQCTHGGRVHDLDDPTPTVTGGQRGDLALIDPFVITPGGPDLRNGRSVNDPLPTVTCSDRFGIVVPQGMDIGFRMLQPHELAAAMGFPADYQFVGTKGDIVRMIGNAWSVRLAMALVDAMLFADSDVEEVA